MSSSSTLFSSSYHVTNNNNNNNSNNKINPNNNTSNNFNQHLTMIKNNSGIASTANNSFIYSSAPSPTISLISSSSSSPSSSSSSPTQLASNSNSSFSNKSVMFGNNSSNISAAKKTAALQNIAASIARSQQLSLASINNNNNTNGATSNQNLANKILALTLENNGVACSVVKSNTNIYYNSKVDTAASKAIHYCTHCTNSDCKAIHKSLTKPLNAASSAVATSSVNVSQSTPLPTPSMATPLFNNQTNQNNATSNTPTSSQQQQLARLFLTSKLEQLDKQANLQRQHHQSIKQQIGEHFNSSQQQQQHQHQQQQQQQHQNSQFNKLLGANVNFIFERRYPLVQLNSNLFNISSNNPTGAAETQASQSLINFINNAGPNSLRSLSPLTNSALTSALSSLSGNGSSSSFHNHSSNRNIMQYRGGTNHTHSQNLFSSDDNETSSMSSPSVSPKGATSFPVPISPPSTAVDTLNMSPPKSTTFSINFNRLPNAASPTSNSSSPTSSSSSPSLNSSNNTTTSSSLIQQKQQPQPTQPLLDDVDSINNLSLRYKNILFLDQVSSFPNEIWNQIKIKFCEMAWI